MGFFSGRALKRPLLQADLAAFPKEGQKQSPASTVKAQKSVAREGSSGKDSLRYYFDSKNFSSSPVSTVVKSCFFLGCYETLF